MTHHPPRPLHFLEAALALRAAMCTQEWAPVMNFSLCTHPTAYLLTHRRLDIRLHPLKTLPEILRLQHCQTFSDDVSVFRQVTGETNRWRHHKSR
jgi:hypothetical protein